MLRAEGRNSMEAHLENGHTAIVHRIPVLDNKGEVKYAVGMVLFEDWNSLGSITRTSCWRRNHLYKNQQEMYGAKYSWDNIVGKSEKWPKPSS